MCSIWPGVNYLIMVHIVEYFPQLLHQILRMNKFTRNIPRVTNILNLCINFVYDPSILTFFFCFKIFPNNFAQHPFETSHFIVCVHWIKNSKPFLTRQIWGIWKLRLAYSPETPNLGQNRWCFVPCDLEIWRMTLENDRASLLCCFKLCATFHSHWWIQTGVTVRKRPFRVKFDDF